MNWEISPGAWPLAEPAGSGSGPGGRTSGRPKLPPWLSGAQGTGRSATRARLRGSSGDAGPRAWGLRHALGESQLTGRRAFTLPPDGRAKGCSLATGETQGPKPGGTRGWRRRLETRPRCVCHPSQRAAPPYAPRWCQEGSRHFLGARRGTRWQGCALIVPSGGTSFSFLFFFLFSLLSSYYLIPTLVLFSAPGLQESPSAGGPEGGREDHRPPSCRAGPSGSFKVDNFVSGLLS